jgi:hypothetical protein
MSERQPVTIVNVGYRSTNYWVVGVGLSRIMVDLGWPGTMGEMLAGLERMGIAGEVVPTPGHSDDSVSLLLDDGSAFTGDLTPPELTGPDNADVIAMSWRRLSERGAALVYPGHGPVRPVPGKAAG